MAHVFFLIRFCCFFMGLISIVIFYTISGLLYYGFIYFESCLYDKIRKKKNTLAYDIFLKLFCFFLCCFAIFIMFSFFIFFLSCSWVSPSLLVLFISTWNELKLSLCMYVLDQNFSIQIVEMKGFGLFVVG